MMWKDVASLELNWNDSNASGILAPTHFAETVSAYVSYAMSCSCHLENNSAFFITDRSGTDSPWKILLKAWSAWEAANYLNIYL